MKIPLLFTLVVCTLLTQAAPLHAAPRKASMDEKVSKLLSTKEGSRAALHEMMQNPETKRMMAKELARDAEFRRLYAAETGSDAPHQERNPSNHPELFQRKKS